MQLETIFIFWEINSTINFLFEEMMENHRQGCDFFSRCGLCVNCSILPKMLLVSQNNLKFSLFSALIACANKVTTRCQFNYMNIKLVLVWTTGDKCDASAKQKVSFVFQSTNNVKRKLSWNILHMLFLENEPNQWKKLRPIFFK